MDVFSWLLILSTASLHLECINSLNIKECDSELGMESGSIPDNAVTASSSYVPNVGPQNGRLKVERAGGGWCPKQQVEQGVREYLEVDLGAVHLVTGVQTQGRYDHGRGQEYTEEYTLEYWRPGLPEWREYKRWDGKQILRGNTDTATVVSHRLMPPVFASKVRVLPYSVHRRTVCLRIELRGCLSHEGVLSYSEPQEPSWEPGQDLADISYDGEKRNGLLYGGLGRLVDGTYGGDNFKLDIGYGKGNGWVGWRNDSFPNGYIELVFEFDVVRNFTAVNIFTNNCFSKGVQVFSKARIQFSTGGEAYNGRAVSYHYMPDEVLENARNVTIQLHNSIGRFVRIRLYFSNRWLLLSEVTFDSEPIFSNYTVELDEIEQEEIVMHSVDPTWDTFETIAAPRASQGYAEIVIGVLTAVMLLLLSVFVIILVLSRRQKLHGSPTTILRNPFSVTINMKDLLMNLTPMNTGLMQVSGQPTPCSQEPPSNNGSVCFQPHGQPVTTNINEKQVTLEEMSCEIDSKITQKDVTKDGSSSDISSYSSIHFRNLQNASSILTSRVHPIPLESPVHNHYVMQSEDFEHDRDRERDGSVKDGSGSDRGSHSSLQFRSLQPSPMTPTRIHGLPSDTCKRKRYQTDNEDMMERDSDSDVRSYSSLHLRTLQNSPLKSARVHSDPPTRKRCHTAPREKLRIAPPAVLWNIAPSMGQPYKSREGDLTPIPRYCLHVIHKIGSCHLGEAQVCDVEGDIVEGIERRVCVRSMQGNCVRELRLLCGLNDPNIVRTLGVCTAEQPPWAVFEFPADLGDLVQLLNSEHSFKPTSLMNFATQIASAMKYLESKNLVHKDLAASFYLVPLIYCEHSKVDHNFTGTLYNHDVQFRKQGFITAATRNCLVGRNFIVKVADIAICNSKYKDDYSEIGGRPPAPIRWLPWESILLERYTCAGTVWSFGVTVWEILGLAHQKPFLHMSDDQVIQNAENMYYGGELQVLLAKPNLCATEVYELMCACWRRDQTQRPTFKEIYLFLKQNSFSCDDSPQYATNHK